jgi:hypothetical protein
MVNKEHLRGDISNAITDGYGGVKLLWAPQGAGKTTTVRAICSRLLTEEGKIAGAIVIKPSDELTLTPASWFRRSLADIRGEIQKPGEFLSQLLGYKLNIGEKPFVIVFDQFENVMTDENLRVFVKTLAEDSVLCKSYVVVIISSNPSKTITMWGWNGRQKITIIGGKLAFARYKWNETDIDQWIREFRKSNSSVPGLEESSATLIKIKEAALKAGTPEFLVTNIPNAAECIMEDKMETMSEGANYYEQLWTLGMQLFAKEEKNLPRISKDP